MLKHLSANVGDTGSNPGPFREIPHTTGELSPCATTIEPVLQSPGAAVAELGGASSVTTPVPE